MPKSKIQNPKVKKVQFSKKLEKFYEKLNDEDYDPVEEARIKAEKLAELDGTYEPDALTDGIIKPTGGDSRYMHFLFTFNNYEKLDYQTLVIDKIKEIAEWALINYEIAPTTGTPHLQGCFRLKIGKRLTELVKLFPKGIWARPSQSVPKCINYCAKDRTRDPDPFKQPIIHGTIPDPQTITSKGIFKVEREAKAEVKQEDVKVIEKLRNWQQSICDMFIDKETPDREPIHWFYSSKGKIGKTSLLRYLWKHHDKSIVYIRNTTDNDIFNHLFKTYEEGRMTSRTTILININRDQKNNINYGILENIKDGLLFNSKYETGQALINPPHIVIMANYPPKLHTLSIDRLKVYEIDSTKDLINEIPTIDIIKKIYSCNIDRVKFYLDNVDKIETAEADLLNYLSECSFNDLNNIDCWEKHLEVINEPSNKPSNKPSNEHIISSGVKPSNEISFSQQKINEFYKKPHLTFD